VFGKSQYRKDMERIIDDLAISYVLDSQYSSPEGRTLLCSRLRELAVAARASGDAKSVTRTLSFNSTYVAQLPPDLRREATELVQRALAE
jgi:hypothetical protein